MVRRSAQGQNSEMRGAIEVPVTTGYLAEIPATACAEEEDEGMAGEPQGYLTIFRDYREYQLGDRT